MNRERTWILSTNQLLSLKENSIWESLRVSYTHICEVPSQKSPNPLLVSWVLTACHKMPDSILIYKPFLNGCSLVLWGGEAMKCPAGELGQDPPIHTEDSSRINTCKAENMLQGSMFPGHREGAKRSRNIPEPRLTTSEGQEGPRWGFSPHTAHQSHPESFWKMDAQDQLNQNLCKMEPRHLTLFFKNTLGDSNAQWGWITTGLESWPLVLCDALDEVIGNLPAPTSSLPKENTKPFWCPMPFLSNVWSSSSSICRTWEPDRTTEAWARPHPLKGKLRLTRSPRDSYAH